MKLPYFGRKTLASSADVAQAIARHDESLAQARTARAGIDAQRAEALLYADDAALDAIDAKAREAALAVERLEARRDALDVEFRELAHNEAAAALDKRRAEAKAKADAARAWLDRVYPRIARDLVAGLRTIQEAEDEVGVVNAAFAEMCRLDAPLAPVEPLQGWSDDDPETPRILIPLPTIAKLTRLVELPGKAPGWGREVDFGEMWEASAL